MPRDAVKRQQHDRRQLHQLLPPVHHNNHRSKLIRFFLNQMGKFKFDFGGLVLELETENIELQPWPYVFYLPFRSQKRPDLRIIARDSGPSLPQPSAQAKLVFDGDSHWQLYRESSGYLMKLYDPKDHIHNKSVVLSEDFQTAEVHLKGNFWYVNDILRPLAEIMTIQYLSQRDGLLVHGAAIRDHDRAYLFIGYSGAGKTTMSQLWGALEGDFSVLGDERIIVRRDEDGWHVYGTPWAGMGFVVSRERVPVSSLFFIRHGKKNEIIEPSKAVLFQDLFTQVFTSFWDSKTMNAVSSTAQQLVEEVPCYQLPFVNTPAVTEFVRDFTHARH